jgi:hypothetical protein
MIFAGIDIRGRSESLLKTKGVFRDRFIKSRGVSFGFRLVL